MEQAKLAVIVGGYLGDEGKGKATQTYLQRYDKSMDDRETVCMRSSGGTNTGATVYYSSVSQTTGQAETLKLSIHMLPVGAFNVGCDSYIGNAVYVNVGTLHAELAQRIGIIGYRAAFANPVYLSRYAHVVTDECLQEDAAKEAEQKLGSTKNGVSVAASRKYAYRGVQVKDLDVKIIEELENSYACQIVEPYKLLSKMSKTHNMVLEGTQGVGLDVNHGFEYPHVSSGSFSTYGLLDGVGYALAPTDVCMVLKSYGSYFGPCREAGDFEDDDFRQFAGEYGTTTKRPRNLSWLDARNIRRAASVVRPTSIMLNCVDLLDYFPQHGKRWAIVIDDENRIEFDDVAIHDGHLTQAGSLFVETIEEYANAPVKFLGIGPKHDDIIER